MERKKKFKIAAIIIAGFLVVLIGGFYIYTLDYYRADETAQQEAAVEAIIEFIVSSSSKR